MQFEGNVYLKSGRNLNNKAAFSLPLSISFLEESTLLSYFPVPWRKTSG